MNIAKNMIGGFPSSISLFVPNGEYCEIRAEYGKSVLNWSGEYKHTLDNVQIRILPQIYAVPVKDGVYLDTDSFYDDKDGDYENYEYLGQLLHGDEIGYFDVSVLFRITDGNTQLGRSRKTPYSDSWRRDFNNQGAETLEGAKAIAEANIREAYREYLDYIYSEREYDTHIDGRSNAHVTVNTNDWNYNFGDTQEDMDYLNWQNKEHGYPYEASTKKSKSVSKASPYTLDWCGDKLFDAYQILDTCFMSNYTSSHHSFFNSVLSEYGVNSHTIIQALRHLIKEIKVRSISEVPSTDYMASTRKSIKSDVEQFSEVVKSIRDRR